MNNTLPNIEGKNVIEAYYRHKEIPYQFSRFCGWAFGKRIDDPKNLKTTLFEKWNQRHEELFVASKDDLFIPTIKRMIDAYQKNILS